MNRWATIDECKMAAHCEIAVSQLRGLIARGLRYHAHPDATDGRGYLFHASAVDYVIDFADCELRRGHDWQPIGPKRARCSRCGDERDPSWFD